MSAPKATKTWSKTSVQSLVKHRSGGYYARLFVVGKERWKSMRTKVLEVAKAKLREEQRQVDQFAHTAKRSPRKKPSASSTDWSSSTRPGMEAG